MSEALKIVVTLEIPDHVHAESILYSILTMNTGIPLTDIQKISDFHPFTPEIVDSKHVGKNRHRFKVALPIELTENDLPSLLGLIAGEATLMHPYRVVDIQLPPSYGLKPRYGISGIYRRLGLTPNRPLLMTILKPTWHLTPVDRAEWVYRLGKAGIDIVKEDEMTVDHPEFPVMMRIKKCMDAVKRVFEETGHRVIYVPTFTFGGQSFETRMKTYQKAGTEALLVSGWIQGMGILSALHQFSDAPLLFLHPALSGFLYHENRGIARALLWGKLAAISGADAVLYPTRFGRFPITHDEEKQIRESLWNADVMPVPGGGLTVDAVPRLIREYGTRCIINIGSGIMHHPEGPEKALKALHHILNKSMASES